MEFLNEVAAWFVDPANWTGRDAIPVRLAEHVALSGVSLMVGIVLALPLGLRIGHTRRWAGAVVAITNVGRAVPSVGILGLALPLTLRLGWGIGVPPTLLALTVLAIPPVVVNAYVGIRDVDPDVVEAARGMGMRESEVLRRVEVPIALPVILAGIRTASVQVIATATLGAILSTGGLGRYIVDGFAQHDYPKMFAGALLVMALALTSEGLFARGQRAAVSPGLRGEPAAHGAGGASPAPAPGFGL